MHPQNGLVAQLNSALDYGSRGYRFESCRGHKKRVSKLLKKPHKSYDLCGFHVFRSSFNLIQFDLKSQQFGQQKIKDQHY